MVLQKTPLTSSPANVPVPVAAAKTSATPKAFPKVFSGTSAPFWIGLVVSVAWAGVVLAVMSKLGASATFAGIPVSDLAIGISATVSPIAMVWMIAAYMQRASDIQSITDPLRRQLTLITGESGAADARIRRFNQAIREQIDLLRSAQSVSQEDMESTIGRVQQHRADLEHLETVSSQQLKEIQDVVRRSMFQVEQMMDDKFTMLRVLDGKLTQNGESLVGRVENIGDSVSRILSTVEQSSTQISEVLDQAQRDSQKLSDTSRLQESSLTNAAQAASDMLGGLSSKIDLNVARFLERAATAREEAERLASALDAQTRALDDFTATLPGRVSDAESILRGVADRLYASEQMAREQAEKLSERLAEQIDSLQSVLDNFVSRAGEVDGNFNMRREDLDKLVNRVGETTNGFFGSWEKTLDELNDRMGNTLLRFTVVNDETRRNADNVMSHLNETTGKYEEAVTRMRGLSGESSVQMKAMTEEITGHLTQFEKLSAASNKAGQEVQARAGMALSNLQSVLERVITARDATSTIGQTLVKDIGDAVTQNEKMIQRLNEAAQAGARTITAATESLGRQEDDLANKARTSEAVFMESVQRLQQEAETASKTLREQTANLMNLLAETQSQLISTDQKLQSFATQAVVPVQKAMSQIDTSADQGLRTLGSFNEGLTLQVERLRDFHTRISTMSTEVGKATSESAGVFESLSSRFAGASAAQEESARRLLVHFSELAERLQREVSGLDGKAGTALQLLQQAATMVGEESVQMAEKAKTSGAQIKEVSSSLQSEAAQIQAFLKQQTDEIGDDLALAERRFSALGELIREKASVTNAALDTTAAHYTDVAQKLDQTVGAAQSKVDTLQTMLAKQVEQLDADALRIEKHATDIASGSGKAIENLSVLKDKMADAREAVADTSAAFEMRTATMSEAANAAAEAVNKSGDAFDLQAGRLADSSNQIGLVLADLTEKTETLTEKSGAIRAGMEQQNARLLMQLSDSVSQLDSLSNNMRQVVVAASQGADDVSTRFADMTEVADVAEKRLSELGANVTQQAATLSIVGEQLSEQQRILTDANEKQRVQMLDLFDKLNDAHAHATEVAVRAITSLSSSLKEIDRETADVSDRSMAAAGNVKAASVGFSDQSVLLLQNAQAAEQQARTVLQVTSALQEQAEKLRLGLQSENDRATETLNSLLGRLSTGSQDVKNIGVNAETVLSSLHKAMGEQAKELDAAVDRIGERQSVLTTALDAQRETMNALLNRLTAAQDLTASTAEHAALRLNEGAQKISQSVEIIDARAQQAITSVQKAVEGFSAETKTVEDRSHQVVQDTQKILSSASEMRTQIDSLRASMQEQGETTNGLLSTLLDKIKNGSADLREVSEAMGMSLLSLNNNVERQTTNLSALMKCINERQVSLVSSLDAQREAVDGLLTRLTKAQDETAASAERGALRLSESAQKVEHHIDVIDSRSQKALISVQAATDAFAKEAEEIGKEAKEAEGKAHGILASATTLREQISTLRKAMENEGGVATDALDTLLTRITSGSGEIREAGSSAEKVLASLQQALDQKTNELDVAMKQIGDRQQTLATSLEAQRETISGLLTRFAQAQEETVVVAERTASRLNEEAQSITTSIDMIGSQASTTLDKVQSSVAAFAEQAVAIKLQSQQAEQQVRSVVTTTSDMKTQAQQMRETMQAETARITQLLTSVIDKLEVAGKQLKLHSTDASETFGKSAETLMTQSQELNKIVDNSENRMAQLNEKSRAQIKVATEFGEQAIDQAQKLANAAEFATTRLVALRDTVLAADKNGTETVANASSRIDEVKAALEAQLNHLTEFSTTAVAQVTEAAKKIASENDVLRSNLSSSEAAMSGAAEYIREEGRQLPATLDRGTKTIEAATKVLKEKASEADQALIGTADRFITATAGARTNMAEEMKRVGTMADEAGKILNGFNELLVQQVSAIQQSAAMLSSEQRELIEKATVGVQTLTEASERLVSVRDEASSTADRLAREFNAIDERAVAATGRLTQVGQGIAKQVEAITEATETAEGRLSGIGSNLRDQLDRIRGGMQSQIDEINRGLLQITAQLERTGVNLRSAAVGAVADVERVGHRFEQTGAAAAAQVKAGTEKMQKATDEVADMLANFGDKFDQMIKHMAEVGTDIKSQEGDSVEKLQYMVGHLATIAEKLEGARAMSGTVSQNAIERLDEVVNAVQAQMTKMTSSAQTAAGVMRGINQIYSDQTASLTRGVGEAHTQVVVMNKSIDEMQQRTDRMRNALKMQGDDLMNSLRQILNQLELTGDGLTDAVNNTLRQQAVAGVKKLN
jgi:hypothetical protein